MPSRPSNATNPEWQCPACGVCYAKAGQSAPVMTTSAAMPAPARSWDIPWGKLLLLGVLAWGGWTTWQRQQAAPQVEAAAASIDPVALAATVRTGDVAMYTTTECVYCHQAKAWLEQNKFPFTECNMSVDRGCDVTFRGHGATGTPFLLVRGHEMKNDFDSDEYMQPLQASL